MVKALPFIHQPDEVVRKGTDVSAADRRYQTHVKRIRIFSRVLLRLFWGLESMSNTVVYMIILQYNW